MMKLLIAAASAAAMHQSTRSIRASSLAALLCICATARADTVYRLTEIGALLAPTGINASGEVVGWTSNIAGGDLRAFLYSGGTLSILGTLGGTVSFGYAINDSGHVVGTSDIASGYGHAFLYSGGVMTDLGTLGGLRSEAYAINASDQVVGSYRLSSGLPLAFLYSSGTMVDLGTLGGSFSVANGINDSGQIVGGSSASVGVSWYEELERAFLYSSGSMVDLGTLGGATSTAFAINASGDVVGESSTGPDYIHAFLFSGGVMADLGTLIGPDGYSFAYAINVHGQVVGGSYYPGGGSSTHGFLYSGGVMADLNDLLDASGEGWTIEVATAINDAGQITAHAWNPAGGWRAVVLTPACLPHSWSGILQPVNADGSSVFKLGRTVSIKFQLTGDCASNTTLVARLYAAKVSEGIVGTETEADSTSSADSGNLFRYSDGQYVFNLGTSGLTTGTWRLRIDLGDGVERTVLISLR